MFVDVCHEALTRGDAADQLARVTELIERLVTETRRVNTITSRMFSFARKGLPGRTPVLISELVEEAVGIIESRARSNVIEITTELPDEPLTILCDRVLIEQTIVNLLNNACSALTTKERSAARSIRITVAPLNEIVRFRVIDNGPGLPHDLKPEQLFEGFFTTSERSRRKSTSGRSKAATGKGVAKKTAKKKRASKAAVKKAVGKKKSVTTKKVAKKKVTRKKTAAKKATKKKVVRRKTAGKRKTSR